MKTLLQQEKIFLLFVLIAGAFLAFFSPGCANIIPPTGGPRDSIAPTLISASPENQTTNFTARRIVLEFDEYIRLGNQNPNDIVVNPPPRRPPAITANLRNLTIRINDTLQPNTTYQIQFGNYIQDVNENNPYPNFAYVFSTGSYLDSLEVAGTVYNAETGQTDSTMTVMLYRSSEDSAIAKTNPDFVSIPNGRGEFKFTHLPPGIFYIYAIKNEGFLRYTSPQSLVAFKNEPVTVSAGVTPNIDLRFFAEEKEEAKTTTTGTETSTAPEEKILRAKISASRSQKQELLNPLAIAFNRPIASFDSAKLRLTDTLGLAYPIDKLEQDTTNNAIVNLFAKWPEKTVFDLYMDPEFARDTNGVVNALADTARFETKSEAEYGEVRLILNGYQAYNNPVLQFVENNRIIFSLPITAARMQVRLFRPGSYTMRLLEDANGNGAWDSGNYWLKNQPEMVFPIPGTVSVRANWENEFEINL